MLRTPGQIAGEVFFKSAGVIEHLQKLKATLGKKFEDKLFNTLEEKMKALENKPEWEKKLLDRIGNIGKNKTADERIGGPYLRYDNELSQKAIGMPPEEQPSPVFSRPEPPQYGAYRTDQVSLPRYQFEVSEQPTLGQTRAVPTAKETTASIVEKLADVLDNSDFPPQAQVQTQTSDSGVPAAVGGLLGAPLGWYAGNEYGMSKFPGYRAVDRLFDAVTSRRGLIAHEPILQNAADVAGGTLWGKKELLKMFGPVGMYRLGGAALGLGGGLLAGSLINKAME